MLSLSPTSAVSSVLDRADAPSRAAVRAGASSASGAATPATTSAVAATQDATQAASVKGTVAGVVDGLSTVAAIGVTVGSIPAALCRMRDIAVATSSGTLTDADEAKLQAEYSQLSEQISDVVRTSVQQVTATPDTDKSSSSAQDGSGGSQQNANPDASSGGDPKNGTSSNGSPKPSVGGASRVGTKGAGGTVPRAATPVVPAGTGTGTGTSASNATPQHIEAAHPAVLAQFRQQASVARQSLSVHA